MDIENTVSTIDSKVIKKATIRDRYNQVPQPYGSIIYIQKVNVKVKKYLFSNWRKTGMFS